MFGCEVAGNYELSKKEWRYPINKTGNVFDRIHFLFFMLFLRDVVRQLGKNNLTLLAVATVAAFVML
jgi:hypothetical protein